MILNIKHDLATKAALFSSDTRKQANYAAMRAINNTAFKGMNKMRVELPRFIDRPTPYTVKSFRVLKRATKLDMTAVVGLASQFENKAGKTPDDVIGHQFKGGQRNWKRFESALHRAGFLPSGMGVAIPKSPSSAAPLDQYGNLQKGLMVQLLSYLNAFAENGYKANMTDKKRGRIEKWGVSEQGYKVINGWVYFVATGKGKTAHLKSGIWAKRGTHGSDLVPVLIFINRPVYKQRIDIEAVLGSYIATTFKEEFSREFTAAMRTAR